MRCKACNNIIYIPTYDTILVNIIDNEEFYEKVERDVCNKCNSSYYIDSMLDVPEIDLCNQIPLGDGNYMTGSSSNLDDS